MDYALAIQPVSDRSAKQGQHQKGQSVGGTDNAQYGCILVREVVDQIGARQHLHLHGRHPGQHAEP